MSGDFHRQWAADKYLMDEYEGPVMFAWGPPERAVPVGAEPPELVGYTTSDETERCCESCGDPCDGACERHETEDR